MRFGSVCSGIEAASVAWHPLGWRASFLSEIAAFPRAVLSHHYPETPLHGDFTTIRAGDYDPIDLLVGGTPCQSFSVAGLRGGLDDDRGNLALEFLRLAQRTRPRWLVWENVPGVLSSAGGRDFGAILGGLVELGYGFAYRVLDAQFFGVAQRRRRVFVVGYAGDWRRAAAVLFERHSLSGHPSPRREAGERAARDVAHSLRAGGFDASEDGTGRGTPLVAGTLSANGKAAGSATQQDAENGLLIAFGSKDHGADVEGDLAPTLRAGGHSSSHANAGVPPAVAYGIRSDASRVGEAKTPSADAEGRVRLRNPGMGVYAELAPTVDASQPHTVAFDTTQITSPTCRSNPQPGDPCHPLARSAHPPAIASSAVRRLTPRECERLQGFPDEYTLIPWRKGMAPDGPRYKALGNSMAVPVMAWIGHRIEAVEAITTTELAA